MKATPMLCTSQKQSDQIKQTEIQDCIEDRTTVVLVLPHCGQMSTDLHVDSSDFQTQIYER